VSQIEVTGRDARVLDQLRNELAAFDLDLTSPEAVVRKVGELIGQLQDVEMAFVEHLRQEWWPVEFNFALSVDQERPLTEEEATTMAEAVAALEELLLATAT
jgi:hypothetical protein